MAFKTLWLTLCLAYATTAEPQHPPPTQRLRRAQEDGDGVADAFASFGSAMAGLSVTGDDVWGLDSAMDIPAEDAINANLAMMKMISEPIEASLVVGAAIDASYDSDLSTALALVSALDAAIQAMLDHPYDMVIAYGAAMEAAFDAALDAAAALEEGLEYDLEAPLDPSMMAAFDAAVSSFLDAPLDAILAAGDALDVPLDATLALGAAVEAALTAAADAAFELGAQLLDASMDAPLDTSLALAEALDAAFAAAMGASEALEALVDSSGAVEDALSALLEVGAIFEAALTQTIDAAITIAGPALDEPLQLALDALVQASITISLATPWLMPSCDSPFFEETCPEFTWVTDHDESAGAGKYHSRHGDDDDFKDQDQFFLGKVMMDRWQCGAEITLTFDMAAKMQSTVVMYHQGFTADVQGPATIVEPSDGSPSLTFTVKLGRQDGVSDTAFTFFGHAVYETSPRIECVSQHGVTRSQPSTEYVEQLAKLETKYMHHASTEAGAQQSAPSSTAKWLAAEQAKRIKQQEYPVAHDPLWNTKGFKGFNDPSLHSFSMPILLLGVGMVLTLVAFIAKTRSASRQRGFYNNAPIVVSVDPAGGTAGGAAEPKKLSHERSDKMETASLLAVDEEAAAVGTSGSKAKKPMRALKAPGPARPGSAK